MTGNETQTKYSRTVEEGIGLCRQGSWRRGLDLLRAVAAEKEQHGDLPSQFYSYLGFGIARYDHRFEEGLRLCRHAVKRDHQPENYLNLARTHMLKGDRKNAVRAVGTGLKIDPRYPRLRELWRELGVRKRPVLRFLSRDHFLNRILGKLRHSWSGDGA